MSKVLSVLLLLGAAVWMVTFEIRVPPGAPLESAVQGSAGPYNVVLVSLDTLRADHLSCYGYNRPTSPNLDRLAAESVLFENAYSVAPATAESHMSMFTGVYPSVHGVWTVTDEQAVSGLARGLQTLPEMLRRHGYRTAGFHDGGHMEESYGFGRGFDVYEWRGEARAEEWLRRNGGKGMRLSPRLRQTVKTLPTVRW